MNVFSMRSRSMRLVVATAATMTAGSLFASSAVADSGDEQLDLAALTTEVLTGTMLIDGNKTRLVDLTSITQVVDEFGKALAAPRTVALRSSTSNPTLGEYACLHRGKTTKHFTALPPTEIFRADGRGKRQALFHPYRQAQARKVGADDKSVQYEVCGVGGADLDGDHRIRKIGLGIAYPDALTTHKVGQAWQSGETPANYTTNLAFKVSGDKKVPIEISGGISQTPTNKLLGSISTPFPTPVDAFARNAVNAWWQDSCVGSWHGCRFIHGSKDFHGAVAQGLWEFTPAQARTFGGFMVSSFLDAS